VGGINSSGMLSVEQLGEAHRDSPDVTQQ
jgi:hypothetical protein